MPEPTESRITRLLGDRYELIELLGKGGFAGVYRVRNLRLQRTEALKVLSEALTEDPDFAKRFEQEARVAAALDHPNIVKIYDYGAVEDFFWFSMQFIGGASVGRELKQRGHFDDATAARIGIGVLDALAYSHARGVIHRDIKPDNILLDHEGRPYLTDFGVAKSQIALVKTQAGTLLGSPAYMSPEQLQGKPLDGRSDLYSVGVTLYRMLSGALPFTGDDTFRATMKRLTEKPESLLSRRSDVHPTLAEIVMRALERNPQERFPEALSMREELENFLTDVTPRATRSSTMTRRNAESAATPPSVAIAPIPLAPSPSLSDEPTIPSGPIFAAATGPSGPGPSAPSPPSSSKPDRRAIPLRFGWVAVVLALTVLAAVFALAHRSSSVPERTPAPVNPERAALPAPSPAWTVAPIPTPSPSPLPTEAPTPEPTAPFHASRLRAVRSIIAPTRPHRATPLPTRRPTVAPTHAPTALPTPSPQGGKRRPPEIVEQSPLQLPFATIAAHHNSSIGIVVIIGTDGKLMSARVIDPVCPECDRAALEAIRRYRFRAATDAKGNPIEGSLGFAIRIP